MDPLLSHFRECFIHEREKNVIDFINQHLTISMMSLVSRYTQKRVLSTRITMKRHSSFFERYSMTFLDFSRAWAMRKEEQTHE